MPDPSPDSLLSYPLLLFENLLIGSEALRERFQALDEAAARRRIYWGLAELGAATERPFVAIGTGDDFGLERVAGGARNELRMSGTLGLYLTDVDRYPNDLKAGMIDWHNWVGEILGHCVDNAGVDTGSGAAEFLSLIGVQVLAPSMRSSPRDRATPIWEAAYLMQIGD